MKVAFLTLLNQYREKPAWDKLPVLRKTPSLTWGTTFTILVKCTILRPTNRVCVSLAELFSFCPLRNTSPIIVADKPDFSCIWSHPRTGGEQKNKNNNNKTKKKRKKLRAWKTTADAIRTRRFFWLHLYLFGYRYFRMFPWLFLCFPFTV